MLLLSRLSNINSQIESYQEQITELQRLVTQLQAHAQEVQGAESAAESALIQVRTAIEMLSAICPDEIATFKSAIDALFAPEPLKLAATEGDDTPTAPALEPTPPSDDEPVEVEAVEAVEAVETSETHTLNGNGKGDASDFIPVIDITSTNGNGNGNGKKPSDVTEAELKQHKRPILIKLANLHGIQNFNSKTRDELAELLAGKVSRENLERVVQVARKSGK